ncbi:MAG: sugar-binding protein [Candidatus Neomarinimicrobiota bacterium]
MNLRQHIKIGLALVGLLTGMGSANAEPVKMRVQDDPVEARAVTTPLVFDGIGDDTCWTEATWQTIDQVWIPYNGTVSAEDYSGRFKVAWSPTENLLYFLVEIHDDVFVDGYRENPTAGVHNFDVVEVFVDEDKSGGLHVFDGDGSLGTNAENAFAYHIYADFPQDGESTSAFRVNDNDGTSWFNAITRNYASHFPYFALRRNGQQAVWEVALIVYNDTYEIDDEQASAARVQLTAGKELGFSMAYCENDAADGVRDNFFGSVHVERADSNNHWINADGFGRLKLVAPAEAIKNVKTSTGSFDFRIFPNPARDSFRIAIPENPSGKVEVKLYNLLGREVVCSSGVRLNARSGAVFNAQNLAIGLYFLEISHANQRAIRKLLIYR